jgi:hypothetical protein
MGLSQKQIEWIYQQVQMIGLQFNNLHHTKREVNF